jgi:hypothetical protein
MNKEARPAYYGHSGILTMKGFVEGKPGLPHFTYAAQVCEKFLGMVFEVPPAVVAMRKGITASSTTNPSTLCYSCHKTLTPLAFQRTAWDDKGEYKPKDDQGILIDDSDHNLVPSYPFRGKGIEAFARAAQWKEAFIRTIIQTHFNFYFGREMRYDKDERTLYRALWRETHRDHFAIQPLIRALVTSSEYLNGPSPAPEAGDQAPDPGADRAPAPHNLGPLRTARRGDRSPLHMASAIERSEPSALPTRKREAFRPASANGKRRRF